MKVFAVAFFAGLFGAQAHAADAVIAEEPAAIVEMPPFTWSGFYVGLNAGYAFGEEVGIIDEAATEDMDGFIGGVQVGYNHQFDRFVLGVEADIQYSGQEGSADLESDSKRL
jgi:outer membrane immunogenic protein